MENIEGVLLRVAEDRESVNWDWSRRCAPFVGSWTPADHVYFLHGSEDVKQDHYVTIARSNAYGLQNDADGAFEAELKEDNQRRYERELKEYEVAQAEGANCASHGFKATFSGFRTLFPFRVSTMHMSAARLT